MLAFFAMILVSGCFGEGTRIVRRKEKAYGKPMEYIRTVEKANQIERRRKNGEDIPPFKYGIQDLNSRWSTPAAKEETGNGVIAPR